MAASSFLRRLFEDFFFVSITYCNKESAISADFFLFRLCSFLDLSASVCSIFWSIQICISIRWIRHVQKRRPNGLPIFYRRIPFEYQRVNANDAILNLLAEGCSFMIAKKRYINWNICNGYFYVLIFFPIWSLVTLFVNNSVFCAIPIFSNICDCIKAIMFDETR